MPKNKIFDEYLENEYNKAETYNFICTRIREKYNFKKRIINLVASLFVVAILVTSASSIYAKKNWEKEYEEYLSRQINSAKVIESTENQNDNAENLNMDYVCHNEVGIKINSLVMKDYTCQIDIDFKIKDEYKDKYKAFEFGYAVFDEKNNIYCVEERNTFNASKFLHYEKKLCEELGIKYNPSHSIPKKITPGGRLNPISVVDGNNIMRLELIAKQKIPESKKMYIRIFNIGYTLAEFSYTGNTGLEIKDAEDFKLSDSEWQFEIDIPNRFYNKNYTELSLSENIEGVDIEKITLSSDGSLSITINTKYSIEDIVSGSNISDESGKTYTIFNVYDPNSIDLIFDIGENNLDKKLYFNLNIPKYSIDKKIELKKVK